MPANERKTLRPKNSFLDHEIARAHIEWVNSAHARVALEAAIAEMTMLLPRPMGLEDACRLHYEILGARRFIDILLNLGHPDQPTVQRPNDNLVWQTPLQKPPPSTPAAKPPRKA